MLLSRISREMLLEAVRLYLAEAYGDAPLPQIVRERLLWPAGTTAEELAAGPMFERSPPTARPAECDRIRLRLGNRSYPHMKLGLDRVPDSAEWILTVDSHDAALVGAASEGERAAVEAMVRYNAEVKTRIERRWTEAGMPTFERFIRERLAAGG